MVEKQNRATETNQRRTSTGYRDTESIPTDDMIDRTSMNDENNLAGTAGTSGQQGAGQIDIPPTAHDDQATIDADDGLVSSEISSESNYDGSGYLESTDENNLIADLPGASNTMRPDQDEFLKAMDAQVPLTAPIGESLATHGPDILQERADHKAIDTPYPNHTAKLRTDEV